MPDREMIKESIIRAVRNGAKNEELRLIIDELLREQETVGGWISVKDRLPESYYSVLCCLRRGGRWTRGVCWLYGGKEWVDDAHLIETGWVVSHWMPLPEPPEEVRGDE